MPVFQNQAERNAFIRHPYKTNNPRRPDDDTDDGLLDPNPTDPITITAALILNFNRRPDDDTDDPLFSPDHAPTPDNHTGPPSAQ